MRRSLVALAALVVATTLTAVPASRGARAVASASRAPTTEVFRHATMRPGHHVLLKPGGSGRTFSDMFSTPKLNDELDKERLPAGPYRPVSHRGEPTSPMIPPVPAARLLTPALGLKPEGPSTSGVSIESTVKVTDDLWEPSGASDGDTVFMTGNADADFSSDGQHFTQVNPNELNPSFCCDQIVQYAPSVDRFFWLVQGNPNASNENVDVLAESSPASLRQSSGLAWTYWTFTTSSLGYKGDWFDYPDLALGAGDLIWTTNLIGSGGSLIFRLPLAQLAAGQGYTFQYYFDKGQMRPAQQTGSTTHWGAQIDSSTLRFYSWPEGQANITWVDVPIPTIATSDWYFTLPNGNVWLDPVLAHTKLNSALQSATVAGNYAYFAWSAGRDVNGKQVWPEPHIEIAVVDIATGELDHMAYIWSQDHAWAWPALTTDGAGDVGVAAVFGGGSLYGFPVVGILTGNSQYLYVTQGVKGVDTAGGHYLTVRPLYPENNCFASFVYDQYPIGVQNNPEYTIFGRSDQLCNHTVATPGVGMRVDPHAASFGATAVDAAGALYVTWRRNGNPGTDMFCKIPSGGTCTHPVVLPLPSGGALAETDQPFPVLAPGGVVYVVAGRYIDDDVVVWTSTDRGHLFGAPTVIPQGSFPNKTNVDDVLLATRTYKGGTSRLGSSFLMSSTHVGLGFGLVTCVCTRPAEPISSFSFSGLSTTQNVSSLSSSLALDANRDPVEAFSTSAIAPTVGFYRYSGNGAIGTQQSWSGPKTVARGYLARLAGGPAGLFLLSEDRAPGNAGMTEVDIRKYGPAAHVFGAPRALVDEPFTRPDAGGALYENQKTGALAVAWPQFSASGKAVMQLWTSITGGKTWSGPTDIAPVATVAPGYAQGDNARLAVADNGQVSLTFLDGNGLELVSSKPS